MTQSNLLAKKEETRLRFKQRCVTAITWSIVIGCVFGTVVLMFVGLRFMLLSSNPQFILKNIVLDHSYMSRPETIDKILREQNVIENQINLFQLQPRELRRALEHNKVIERAEIQRVLPNTLKIQIIEKQPRARLIHRGKLYFLTKDGQVLPDRKEAPNIFPLVMLDLEGDIHVGDFVNTRKNKAVFNFLNYYESHTIARHDKIHFPSNLFSISRLRIDDRGDLNVFLKKSDPSNDYRIAKDNVILKLNGADLKMSLHRASVYLIENQRRAEGHPIKSYIDAITHSVGAK